MRKTIFIVLAILFSAFMTEMKAEPVSKEQACQVTLNKLLYLNKTGFKIKNIEPYPNGVNPLFYIARLNPKGFVIISGDTGLFPVYAYSFSSDFDNKNATGKNPLSFLLEKNLQYHLKAVNGLDGAKQRINAAWNHFLSERPGNSSKNNFMQWPPAQTTGTGGWLETNWHQQSPYNQFCPVDPVTGGRSIAGCPSIALGMIINYYQNLNETVFSDADDYYHNYAGREYMIDDDHEELDFLSFTEINSFFDSIANKYAMQEAINSEEASALCFAAGVAATQVYTSSASGTFGVDQAYEAYQKFGFISAELVDETTTDVYSILAENMMEGKPAHLAVTDPPPVSVGHNLVVDGYNTDDYFHLNFGWGGSYNSWYLIPEGLPYGLTELEGVILNIDTPPVNNEAEIYHFSFEAQTQPATIENDTIRIEVGFGTDLTELVPVFQLSRGATATIEGTEIISNETGIDFSNSPVTIAVASEDQTLVKEWQIFVSVAPDLSLAEILSFELEEQISPAIIYEDSIRVTVEPGTDVSDLVPVFSLSEGATAEFDGQPVISGETGFDFSAGYIVLLVTSGNEENTKAWNIHVDIESGIEDISGNFNLYPNPCSGTLHIVSKQIQVIEIYTQQGKFLESLHPAAKEFSLNIKNRYPDSNLLIFKFYTKDENSFCKKILVY